MKRLTHKQLQFTLGFMETGNRVEAYRRAYDCSNMSDPTIRRKAQEVATLEHVEAKITEFQAQAQQRNEVTIDRVIQEFVQIAYHDIGEFTTFTDDGQMEVDWEGLMRSKTSRAIKSLTQEVRIEGKGESATKVTTTKVTYHNKNNALRDLGRHLGLFPKDGVPLPAERFQIILNLGNDKGKAPKKKPPKKVEGKVV